MKELIYILGLAWLIGCGSDPVSDQPRKNKSHRVIVENGNPSTEVQDGEVEGSK